MVSGLLIELITIAAWDLTTMLSKLIVFHYALTVMIYNDISWLTFKFLHFTLARERSIYKNIFFTLLFTIKNVNFSKGCAASKSLATLDKQGDHLNLEILFHKKVKNNKNGFCSVFTGEEKSIDGITRDHLLGAALFELKGEILLISRIKKNNFAELGRGEITDAVIEAAKNIAKEKGAKEILLEPINEKIKSFYSEKRFIENGSYMSMLIETEDNYGA